MTHFTIKQPHCGTKWSQRIMDILGRHPLGTMNVCTKFLVNKSNICGDILFLYIKTQTQNWHFTSGYTQMSPVSHFLDVCVFLYHLRSLPSHIVLWVKKICYWELCRKGEQLLVLGEFGRCGFQCTQMLEFPFLVLCLRSPCGRMSPLAKQNKVRKVAHANHLQGEVCLLVMPVALPRYLADLSIEDITLAMLRHQNRQSRRTAEKKKTKT